MRDCAISYHAKRPIGQKNVLTFVFFIFFEYICSSERGDGFHPMLLKDNSN